ncbi:hypothetical protein N0V93_004119 [Gnomoniopsis smithogilvyi]|uniref:Uncharacterized protein n=1 Tax=Gnomoniopsis smithogilvyi TaxID=1191159 RepID=A0A9W8YZR9_9PEZI|nr:hypothetical protein N0V93_004119 [Gnomoniopsis smithogilvyi]
MAAPVGNASGDETYNPVPASPLPGVDGVYSPTSEMPLMKGFMARFTQAIDENNSMFEISLMLKDAVDQAKAVSDLIPVERTIGEFERERYIQMVQLLHYVHPLMLKAIARGTLAYEHENNPAFRDQYQYNAKTVPGTYAVSVSINGRGGKFLNQRELERLAEYIDEYGDAAEAFHKKGEWDAMRNIDHAEHMGFVDMVDSKLSGSSSKVGNSAPRFAPAPGTAKNLRELAEMFRRRIDATLPSADDVREDFQIQAPVMIGCTSEAIWEGTEHHEPKFLKDRPLSPTAGSLQSTTPTWALTLSILAVMGMKFKVVRVAALAIFDLKDLSRSEILLTTVAQSLVWQTGFNIIQGGGQYDPKAKKPGYTEEKDVCSKRNFLRVNLNATCQRIQQLRNNLEIRKILQGLNLNDLDQEICQLHKLFKNI